MCHYFQNLGHVSWNCRKLQNKNRRFQYVHYQKSLKSASTSITTLVESVKSTHVLFHLSLHGSLTLEPPTA